MSMLQGELERLQAEAKKANVREEDIPHAVSCLIGALPLFSSHPHTVFAFFQGYAAGKAGE